MIAIHIRFISLYVIYRKEFFLNLFDFSCPEITRQDVDKQLPEVSAGYLRGYGCVMSIIRCYFKQNLRKV
jgi:hypothetical protein